MKKKSKRTSLDGAFVAFSQLSDEHRERSINSFECVIRTVSRLKIEISQCETYNEALINRTRALKFLIDRYSKKEIRSGEWFQLIKFVRSAYVCGIRFRMFFLLFVNSCIESN